MCCVPLSSSDDEEMLFNPDCTVQLLVDDIKRRCGCDKSSECVFTHLRQPLWSPYMSLSCHSNHPPAIATSHLYVYAAHGCLHIYVQVRNSLVEIGFWYRVGDVIGEDEGTSMYVHTYVRLSACECESWLVVLRCWAW